LKRFTRELTAHLSRRTILLPDKVVKTAIRTRVGGEQLIAAAHAIDFEVEAGVRVIRGYMQDFPISHPAEALAALQYRLRTFHPTGIQPLAGRLKYRLKRRGQTIHRA